MASMDRLATTTMRSFYHVHELLKRAPFIDPNDDPNIGNSRGDNRTRASTGIDALGGEASTSGSALLSTCLPALLFAAVWLALFVICRRTQHRFYAPKSYLGHIHDYERSPELPTGWLNWFPHFWRMPDSHVLRHSSLDGYLFLRFLKLMSLICCVGALVTWPILFPVNVTGGAGNTQLDLLSIGNVSHPNRYYAHALVSWVFFGYVFYMVTRESIFYASLRQVYLLSPLYANRISSRTVLFLSVPQAFLNTAKLSAIFGGSVKRIWITSDTRELEELVERRDDLAFRLEDAETRLLKSANTAYAKALKAEQQSQASESQTDCEKGNQGSPSGASWMQKVKRPTHRRPFLVGKKVDTITWLRDELAKVIPEVDELQRKHRNGEAKAVSAVFVEFDTQTNAQIAFQTLPHHHPFRMTPRFIGIPPDQVVWSSLRYTWWQRIIRKFLFQGFITALIIFWSFPSAVVGMITNITSLTDLVPFLGFINNLPGVIKGVITGLLPAIGLAIIMALVPPIVRWCARQSGLPSKARVELFTQNANFCFQVIQVFLVTTITSAASAATTKIIKDPLSAKDLLATNLPKASNFYISYFLFQGLVLGSVAVVQVVAFIVFKVLRVLFDSTPRRLYQRWARLTGIYWSTVFPIFTNMGVIAITYSCIAPLTLGFAALGLFLVYQAYRYNLLFVYDTFVDTKGMVYPRALQHLLTGVYLAEICMIGLFALRAAVGPLMLMVLFTVVTVLAHISLNEALTPLLTALPRSLGSVDEEVQEGDEAANNGFDDEEAGPRVRSVKVDEAPCSPSDTCEKQGKVATSSTLISDSSPARQRRKLPSLMDWLLHPSVYADYTTLRGKMRQEKGIQYDEDIANNAFYPPAVTSPTPLLWVPRDAGGLSQQEVEATSRVIQMTDSEAHLNEKNKVVWDKVSMKPPIYQEKIFY